MQVFFIVLNSFTFPVDTYCSLITLDKVIDSNFFELCKVYLTSNRTSKGETLATFESTM